MQQNNNYLEVAYLYKLFVSLVLNFEIEVEDAKLEIIKIMQAKAMKKHNLKQEFKKIQQAVRKHSFFLLSKIIDCKFALFR